MIGESPTGNRPIGASGYVAVLTAVEVLIAQKVTSDFPSKLTDSATNYSTDAFKDVTSPGRCLEFFNGKIYFASNNFVYCTKTFDVENIDLRYSVVAGFPSDVTMIARVTDGLYVATATDTYFLAGSAPEEEFGGFRQSHVAKFGAIYNTQVRYQADVVKDAKDDSTVVLWSNEFGVWAGANGGKYTCMSLNQISVPAGSVGTAMVTERNGIYQYVVTYNDAAGKDANVSAEDSFVDPSQSETIVLNLVTGAHSRYFNFAFNSYFKYGNKWYGANETGLYELDGNSDSDQNGNSFAIDAFIKTPITDFDYAKNKVCHEAFLNARAAGTIKLDITTDENEQCNGLDFLFDLEEGKHRRRCSPPNGLIGNSWQFTIRNNNGGYFKIFDFEVNLREVKRTI